MFQYFQQIGEVKDGLEIARGVRVVEVFLRIGVTADILRSWRPKPELKENLTITEMSREMG